MEAPTVKAGTPESLWSGIRADFREFVSPDQFQDKSETFESYCAAKSTLLARCAELPLRPQLSEVKVHVRRGFDVD